MKEQIILFGITDHNDMLLLRQALMPLRIRLKAISSDQYGKSIGELTLGEPAANDTNVDHSDSEHSADDFASDALSTGVPAADDHTSAGHLSENEQSIPAPMLVFCGLTSARLDAVLQAMRRKNIRIPHKAVLTLHNAVWTPKQLFEALEEERKQFESK